MNENMQFAVVIYNWEKSLNALDSIAKSAASELYTLSEIYKFHSKNKTSSSSNLIATRPKTVQVTDSTHTLYFLYLPSEQINDREKIKKICSQSPLISFGMHVRKLKKFHAHSITGELNSFWFSTSTILLSINCCQ